MRIVFFGTPAPAVPALQAFLATPDIDVVAVVTNPDRPAGRGHRLRPPPVKVTATEAGVDVWQPERPRAILERLGDRAVDACAVVAYGSILPSDLLLAGGAGYVNLHFSLLPAWRGAAPVPASILAGDTVTGITCFRLDAGMDTGDTLLRESTEIRPEETSGELTQRLAVTGAPTLVAAVRGLVDGSLHPVAQNHDEATYAPKISPEDARLDFGRPAVELGRMVRAFNPMPGAHTTLDGVRLKVHRATPVADVNDDPGLVVAQVDGRPVVATSVGGLRLDEVQPAGKPRMDGRDFANGYDPVRLGT